MKLNDLRPLMQETFKGTYRLTGRVACFDDEGIPYLKLRLSSCASDIVVLAVIGSILIQSIWATWIWSWSKGKCVLVRRKVRSC